MELNADNVEHVSYLGTGTWLLLIPVAFILLFQWRDAPTTHNGLPLINAKGRFEFIDLLAKKRFITNAQDLLKAGLKKVRHPQFAAVNRLIEHLKASAFNIITENGIMMVLDPKYAEEIRNSKTLSLRKTLIEDMHVNVPGFEQQMQALEDDEIFQTTLKTKLTRNLEDLNEVLSQEAT
ncbi:hypothetical protein AbraIFM66950_002645, partial [Aspergillus brasiliensis]